MQLVHCLITELLGLRRIHVNVGRYAVLVIKNPKSVKPQTQPLKPLSHTPVLAIHAQHHHSGSPHSHSLATQLVVQPSLSWTQDTLYCGVSITHTPRNTFESASFFNTEMIELQWVLGIEMCDTQAAILSLLLNCIHGPVLQELDHYSMLTYLPLNAPYEYTLHMESHSGQQP